jgi:hypothetical protein
VSAPEVGKEKLEHGPTELFRQFPEVQRKSVRAAGGA